MKERIRTLLEAELPIVDFDSDFLFSELDSLGVVTILMILSQEFGIELESRDATPKNFRSLDTLVELEDAAKQAGFQVIAAVAAIAEHSIARQFAAPRTFDEKGWLRIGFAGSQINMSETYINTGSVYLCTFGFLALGLPETDPFWTEPFTPWTGLKAWNGEDVMADHAIGD